MNVEGTSHCSKLGLEFFDSTLKLLLGKSLDIAFPTVLGFFNRDLVESQLLRLQQLCDRRYIHRKENTGTKFANLHTTYHFALQSAMPFQSATISVPELSREQ